MNEIPLMKLNNFIITVTPAKNNKEIIKIILGNIISIDENYKNEIENVIINI